jgi:hypothetical protein
MGTGLQPEDEFLHRGPDGSDGSDCLAFTFYDIPVRLGALFRLDSRPGQGYTQLTACLYLPDGRAAFVSERSGLGRESNFDGGGLRVEVVRPYQELHVSYDGKLMVLDDPAAMLHPDRQPAGHPHVDAEVHLTYTGISTLYEAVESSGRSGRPPTDGAADGHYEQLVSGFGSVRVGDARWAVDGLGLRAHRWGSSPVSLSSYRRRMTANIGPSFGFMASRVATEDGGGSRRGFVWDGTALHVCTGVTIKTAWSGGDRVPRAVELTLNAGDQTWHASGTVLTLLARPGDGSEACDGAQPPIRTCEALTEWRLDDGQVGYGLAEHVDRIVEGGPAGFSE